MSWYKVLMIVPGTDGDAENGPCEPQWWEEMEQAPDEETAVRQANAKARAQWENSDEAFPSGKDMGVKCPVCTGAKAVTDEEHDAWENALDEQNPFSF